MNLISKVAKITNISYFLSDAQNIKEFNNKKISILIIFNYTQFTIYIFFLWFALEFLYLF